MSAPEGSGIWWINYYVKGKQHREKVGRKSDAIALYQKRKADSRRGEKLPELRPQKVTTFGELAIAAVDYAERRVIRLTETKNRSARNVPLNSVALSALRTQP